MALLSSARAFPLVLPVETVNLGVVAVNREDPSMLWCLQSFGNKIFYAHSW